MLVFKKIIILSFLSFSLVGCKNKENIEENQPQKVIIEPTQEVEKDYKVNDVKEDEYKKIPSLIVAKLSEYASYKLLTKGQSVSSSIIKVTQNIDATSIKGEYSYTRHESKSNILSTVHEAYYHDLNAIYRDSETGDFTNASLDEYINIYGTYPFEASIEGYIIKIENIKSITKVSQDNNLYTFKVVLDEIKSVSNVKIQMKKFGGLDDFPSFSLVEMNLTIDEDFTLRKLDLHTKYIAKKVLSTKCEQNYTVNYSMFNENIEIPNLENIKPLFI